MVSAASERRDHFRANCLAWTALNHFLSADLLREFSRVLVDTASVGQLSLELLFDESLSEGREALASWVVRPLQIEFPLAQYLQNRIRYFVWANDGDVYFDADDAGKAGSITPKAIESAVRLGLADLYFPQKAFDPHTFPDEDTIRTLVTAIDAAVAMKHLGDLSVDADEWENAYDLYRMTQHLLDGYENPSWGDYPGLLRAITTQSIAAALRTTKGPAVAAALLSLQLQRLKVDTSPLALLNGSVDASVAESLASESMRFTFDRRASIAWAPQLLASHDLTSAFEAWIAGEHTAAHRQFWRVLRRQIALGSATLARQTKAFFMQRASSTTSTRNRNGMKRTIYCLWDFACSLKAAKPPWPKRLNGVNNSRALMWLRNQSRTSCRMRIG
jgi:hypothetical protein